MIKSNQKVRRSLIALMSLLGLVSGCKTVPTKLLVREQRNFDELIEKTDRPLVFVDSTLILDARSSFEYGLNRVADSQLFDVESLRNNSQTSKPLMDVELAQKRLALRGIKPYSSIIVVGNGLNGQGEEAELAWHLLYFGLTDVQIASMDTLRSRWTQAVTPPIKNATPWSSSPRSELLISRSDFSYLANDAIKRRKEKVFLIDVRSQKEYLGNSKGQDQSKKKLDVGAINIEWKEFFNSKGRPDLRIKQKLKALGMNENDSIIVFGQQDESRRPSAAAYALIALGFRSVQRVE